MDQRCPNCGGSGGAKREEYFQMFWRPSLLSVPIARRQRLRRPNRSMRLLLPTKRPTPFPCRLPSLTTSSPPALRTSPLPSSASSSLPRHRPQRLLPQTTPRPSLLPRSPPSSAWRWSWASSHSCCTSAQRSKPTRWKSSAPSTRTTSKSTLSTKVERKTMSTLSTTTLSEVLPDPSSDEHPARVRSPKGNPPYSNIDAMSRRQPDHVWAPPQYQAEPPHSTWWRDLLK